MQRIVCPDTKSWTMVERLISVDVERLGNVQWWSLVSQYTSDQLVRTTRCEGETRDCCAVSAWDITRDLVLQFSSRRMVVKRGTRIAIMMEHERSDRVFSATCVGVRPVVPEAEADQGVALVIVMLSVPRVDRQKIRHEERSCEVWVQTSVKHARSCRRACTLGRFLMTTDAETALASSWQGMITSKTS